MVKWYEAERMVSPKVFDEVPCPSYAFFKFKGLWVSTTGLVIPSIPLHNPNVPFLMKIDIRRYIGQSPCISLP